MLLEACMFILLVYMKAALRVRLAIYQSKIPCLAVHSCGWGEQSKKASSSRVFFQPPGFAVQKLCVSKALRVCWISFCKVFFNIGIYILYPQHLFLYFHIVWRIIFLFIFLWTWHLIFSFVAMYLFFLIVLFFGREKEAVILVFHLHFFYVFIDTYSQTSLFQAEVFSSSYLSLSRNISLLLITFVTFLSEDRIL